MTLQGKLIEVGNLKNKQDDGITGIRLKLKDDRVITIRGLSPFECVVLAQFFGKELEVEIIY